MSKISLFLACVPWICVGAQAQAPGAHWSMTTTLSDPPLRIESPGAADFSHMYVFGGRTTAGVRLNDLWSFDGTSWTMMTADGAAGSPPGRDTAGVAWNYTRNRLTVFGGGDATGNPLGDTWEWDPATNTWADVTPVTGPTARRNCALAFDPASGKMLLFGGKDGGGNLNDTWTFDGTAWTQLTPAGALPGVRQYHHLVTRLDYGDVILCGGYNTTVSTNYLDTWRWDGATTSWVQIVTAHNPNCVFANDTAYDMLRKRIVMAGGNNSGGNPQGIISEFDSVTNDWVQRPLDSGIYKVTRYFAAYVPALGKTYKVSGQALNANAPADKTYEFQSDVPATFTSATPGCATSAGVPELRAAVDPWVGRDFVLEVSHTPAMAATVLAFDVVPIATPIPLSAIGIGDAACIVTVNPVFTFLAAPSPTTGLPTLTIPIPNDAALVGAPLLGQGFVIDFGVASTYVSNRGDAVLGAL